jgi:hypothetical protein
VTLDKKFYNLLFKQEVVAAPVTATFSSSNAFLAEARLDIYNNYATRLLYNIMIMCIINNNNAINNDNY